MCRLHQPSRYHFLLSTRTPAFSEQPSCIHIFIRELPALFTRTAPFLEKYLYSGLVFYGGLYDCLLALLCYCRANRLDISVLCPYLPAIPLFHAFGRIGCFCMGCCYGIVSVHGIRFTQSQIAPNGIPLIPVQLIEAAAELLIFVVLVCLLKKRPSTGQVFGLYLLLYGIVRFFLEFLRGDQYRGFLFALSISQIISLVGIAAGSLLLLLEKSRQKPLSA